MKTKTFGLSMLTAISVLTLSAVAFGTNASATDTASPAPIVTADSGVSDDVEILSLLSAQADVTENAQVVDTVSDTSKAEDVNERAAFDADVKAAVLAGDSARAAQITAAEAIVTSIDSPEIAAIAADDAEANTLIIGVPQK